MGMLCRISSHFSVFVAIQSLLHAVETPDAYQSGLVRNYVHNNNGYQPKSALKNCTPFSLENRVTVSSMQHGNCANYSCTKKCLKVKARDISKRVFVEHVEGNYGQADMLLAMSALENTDSQGPSQPGIKLSLDSKDGLLFGQLFNLKNHKPTFTIDRSKGNVDVIAGPVTSPYRMDQLHFHVYCTRSEAERNTLDKRQVPGELHLVFFNNKYKTYNSAVQYYKDGLMVISLYLQVAESPTPNKQVAKFARLMDSISRNASLKTKVKTRLTELAPSVFDAHAQYKTYKGNLVLPIRCKMCVTVVVMKEPLLVTREQMLEFRKVPHCKDNDWGF